MQVFKVFIKTAKKFLPMNLMFFVIFCAIAIASSNYNTDPDQSAFQVVSMDVGIVDKDNSKTSLELRNYLETMHHMISLDYEKETLLDGLFYRTLDYVLILPEGFEKRLLNQEEELFETVQIPGIYSSAFVDEQVNSYIRTLKLYLSGGFSLDETLLHTKESFNSSSNQVNILELKEDNKNSDSMTSIYFFYQFLAYVILSMILCGLTPILIIFWEENLAKRISCSSTSLLRRNFEIALGSIVYCLFIWLLFIFTSRIFYGSEVFDGQGLLWIANSFLLIPVGISISLIIGCFAPTGSGINALNNIITLGMSFLCGVFVPHQQLGESVLSVSKYFPIYWYIKNNDLVLNYEKESFEMKEYWNNFGIQILYGAAIFAVALAVSKFKSSRQKS